MLTMLRVAFWILALPVWLAFRATFGLLRMALFTYRVTRLFS